MPSTAPPWTPPAHVEAELTSAGYWWDAIAVPALRGSRALTILGEASGAVIEDPVGQQWYWLVEPGAADQWPRVAQVRLLREACYVVVPGLGVVSGGGTRWRVPWTRDGYLTDADRLRRALWAA